MPKEILNLQNKQLTNLIGDIVDAALKIADKRHEIELGIKEALLAGDDEQVKRLVRQLVGLEP